MATKLATWILSLIVLSLISSTTWAAKIVRVKDETKIIIDLEDMIAEQGTVLVAISPEGKRKAIIKILKVKGSKALGRKIKGKAEAGYTLVTRENAKKSKSVATPQQETTEPSESTRKTLAVGGMLGMGMDKMDVEVTTSNTVNMSGIGFSGKAFMDYHYTDLIGFRGMGGLELFNVKGTLASGECTGTTDCTTDIVYGSLDLILRLTFLRSASIDAWAGLGPGVVFPLSKETNALEESSIVATTIFLFTAGLDWNINADSFIPIAIDYAIFPASDQVTASWFAGRIGYGMRF